MSIFDECEHLIAINPRLGPGVDAGLLRLRDTLCLALAPYVCLELREHGQHTEERATRRRCRVDALLDDAQVRADGVDLVRNVCEVTETPMAEVANDRTDAIRATPIVPVVRSPKTFGILRSFVRLPLVRPQ